jgi:hypothetical protein
MTIAYIRRKPSRLGPVTGDVLSVVEVAAMLLCSIDSVRRIPDASLPSRVGPGKCVLYLREDVLRFVRSLPENGGFRGANSGETRQRRKSATANEGRAGFDPQEALARVAHLKRPS